MQFSIFFVLLWSFFPFEHSLAWSLTCQQPAAESIARSDKNVELISVAGVVVDQNDQPIADAVVYLREWAVARDNELEVRGGIFTPKRKYTFAKTKSDQLGKFSFNQVASPPFKANSQGSSRWTVVAEVPGRPKAWFKLAAPKSDQLVRLVIGPGTTVQGVVRDSQQRPIPGVEVYVDMISQPKTRQYQVLDSPTQFVYRNSDLSPRTTTGADGKFSIPNLPTERRIGLAFIHSKFVSQIDYAGTTTLPQQPMQERTIRHGKTIDRTIPIQTGAVQIDMVEGHRLMGRLVDEQKSGIANQDFELLLVPSMETKILTTDVDGRFESRRFRDTQVQLRVKRPNNDRYVACEEEFQFEAEEVEKKIEYQLPVARTIKGTLNSEDSKPISNAKIVFIPDGKPSRSGLLKSTTTVRTNDSGEYEMRVSAESGHLVPVGPVFAYELSTIDQVENFQRGELNPPPKFWGRVDPESFGKSSDQNGNTVALVDLVGSRAQIVTGRVLNEDGKPVVGASIDVVDGLFEWHGLFKGMSREQIQKLFHTRTDDQGKFQIGGIPRNTQAVFSVLDSERSQVALVYLDQLTSFSDVTVKLSKGIVLTGKVILDGRPVPDATIFLNVIGEYEIQENGRAVQEQFHWGQMKTDEKGNYRFSGVPAKPQYFVSARIANRMNASHDPKLDPTSRIIEVPDFEFKSLNASIAGVVVDPSGKPVAGVELSAVDAKSRRYFGNNSKRIYSESDGSFQIDGLPENTAVSIRASTKPDRMSARIVVMSGDKNARLILDPRLGTRPRKIQKSNSKKFP